MLWSLSLLRGRKSNEQQAKNQGGKIYNLLPFHAGFVYPPDNTGISFHWGAETEFCDPCDLSLYYRTNTELHLTECSSFKILQDLPV